MNLQFCLVFLFLKILTGAKILEVKLLGIAHFNTMEKDTLTLCIIFM